MKCCPLTSTGCIGSISAMARNILNDVCSNVSLMDLALFNTCYDHLKMDTSHMVGVHGIGRATTTGHCKAPIWMEGHDSEGKPCLIKMDVEFHLIENFAHGVLLGIDTLSDYGIDLFLSSKKALLGPLSYPIDYNQKFKSVLIRAKDDITVYGRTCMKIPIKSHMLPKEEYIFTPHQFLQRGQPVGPSLSLSYTILNSTVQGVMFQNTSNEPLHLKKGQVLGRATMGATGYISDTSMEVDWSDLIQLGVQKQFLGLTTPSLVSTNLYKCSVPGTF